MSRARQFHNIAERLGVDPELVAMLATQLKLRSNVDIEAAVLAYVANEKASKETPVDEDPSPKTTSRKAPLTLSQRRALVKLQADPQNPASAFKALPYDYLESVGLAKRLESGAFVLTQAGIDRAAEINPLYVRWSAGETVAGDPTRPPAGTHRATATTLL